MNYAIALIIGAWLLACFRIADREHREADISRAACFVLVAIITLFWLAVVGSALRERMLRPRKNR